MTQETQRRGSITPAMARRIEIWPVDRLIPYVKNPRTHSEEQVAQIAASIVEFGFTAPILVASDAGILAGHGRLLAAQKLGLPEVPVVPLDHLSETQRKAYVIADNQLALNAGWNLELLRGELESLKENDFDLDLVGFTDKELDDLLADPEDEERANAAPPLPENAVSRPGDLWICGEHRNQHRVLCADATSPEAVAKLLGERRPHLMVTDPPYGIELDSEWRDRAGLNGCGPAEASYMKHRTEGHTETTISGDHMLNIPDRVAAMVAAEADAAKCYEVIANEVRRALNEFADSNG